ncbi:beta strand repeat-containing protein, partial [Larkinella harenae]
MKTWIMMQNKMWTMLLMGLFSLFSSLVSAQVCDPLGQTPLVDFRLTYDPGANRYTAWYIPTANNPHRLVTGQFTIVTNNGFTTPGGNGADAPLVITNINGTWADQAFDNELIASLNQPTVPVLDGYTVHQVGKAPTGDDVDPDGPSGPLNSDSPVTAGVPVPLFSFPGRGCASDVRILVNGEPIQQQLMQNFGFNTNNQLSFTISRQAGSPTLDRYCKNDAQSQVVLVLPDIQNDSLSLCATSTSYSNNYFTQVLRNWNPANLPNGTSVVPTSSQQWGSFTVTPASLQSNVSVDPATGAYTITFPTVGGVTQPGSVTICNTLRDICNTASDQACVIVSWLSSGQVSITSAPTVCLTNGSATFSLSATNGFTTYNWSGSGLATATGNPVTATVSTAGVYSYTVLATNAQSCSATAITSVTVLNGAEIEGIIPTNPTTCPGTDGSVVLTGLVPGQSYSVTYTRNGANPSTQTVNSNSSGQVSLTGLSAGVYSFTASNGVCASTPLSTTLTDPNPPAPPTLSVGPSATICLGNSLTATATGVSGATFSWTGENLNSTTGSVVTALPATAGQFVYTVTQTVGGCTSLPASVTVTVNPTPTITVSPVAVTACVGGSFDLSATGTPTGSYTYTWTGPNFSTTTTTSPLTVSSASLSNNGAYTVSVRDANGCSATSTTAVSVSVTNCCSLSVTAIPSQTVTCAGTPVTLSVTTSGAIGTLGYQWSPNVTPGNSQSISVNPTATTTYTVVVTDQGAANCSGTATITVNVNPTPVVSIVATSNTVCAGNPIVLTANVTTGTVPPYNYSWVGPNFATTTTTNTISIPNATAANSGNYTVTITDQNGCTATAGIPASVTVTPSPVFTLTPTNPTSCPGTDGSLTIGSLISGQLYSISYSRNGGAPISIAQTATAGQVLLSPLTSGVYSVTVSLNGCVSAPQSVTLTDPTPPAPPVITVLPSATVCLGTSLTLSATGTNLQWTGTNLTPMVGSPVMATPAASGTFTYSVTQTVSGCTSSPASLIVVVNPVPSIISLTAPPTCVGQAMSLSATISGGTGQYIVNWQTPDGLALVGNPLTRANAQVSMGGTYTAIVSDANLCTTSQTISTSVGVAPSVIVQPQQVCAGNDVTLTATAGAANYLWFGPNNFTASGQIITLTGVDASDAGSYTVVVTGGNSCTGTATADVTVNLSPVVSASFFSNTVCVGSPLNLFGNITTGTRPPYEYSWTGPDGFGSTSQNPSIISAQVSNSGSYTFTVTDMNGCSATATTPVAVSVVDCCPPRIATISITAEDPACGASNGSATATLLPASAAGTQVTYQWRNVASQALISTAASVSGLTAGVYSVTITETNGNCVQSFTNTVAISEAPGPNVAITQVSGANCGASNGSATLAISGGTTPYTISWSGASSGSTTTSLTEIQINGLAAGNYIFTINGQGSTCRGIQNVTIPMLPTSLSLTTEVSQPVTCGTSGTVVISWNSVGGPYQLTIDGVATPVTGTSQTLIVAAGTHSIQIASGNPLCVSDSKVVVINPVPAPLVVGWDIQQQPLCAEQMGIIRFTGGQSSTTQYTLSYINGPLIGTTAGNVPRTFNAGAGQYVVTRIEPSGCSSSLPFEIVAPAPISFNVQPTVGLCGQPGSLVVTNISGGTSGYTVTYAGPVSGSSAAGIDITGLPAGTYSITVTDFRGCTANRTVVLSSEPGPAVEAFISSNTTCVGSSFTLNATVTPAGSYTYTWRGPANFTANGSVVTVGPATLAQSGSYTVVVTSSTGCSTTQVTANTITVTDCQPPCTIGINVITSNAHCSQSDGQATVTAVGGSGNYSYRWSNGVNTPTITGLATGVYSVTVTDAISSACFSTTLITIGNAGGPQIAISNLTPATCAGATGAVSVTVTGGSPIYTYQWNNGAVTNSLNGIIAGVYSVTATDQNGCKDVELITIPSTPGSLTATISSTASTCNQANGTATVIVSGGSPNYSYRWNSGGTSNPINGLVAGVYSVTITDASQCSVTASVRVNDATGPQFTINKTNINCQGGANGSASVNITNAIGSVTYLWSNGAVGNSISGLTAGTYSVTVTDGNGCKSGDIVTITQPTAIVAELSASTIACGGSTGSITITNVRGGTGPGTYSYRWNNGSTNANLMGVAAGVYSLTITDGNGCIATGTATLVLPTDCPTCQPPMLTVSTPICSTVTGGLYTVSFVSSTTAVSVVGGTINGTTVTATNNEAGMVITAAGLPGCPGTSLTIAAPSCPSSLTECQGVPKLTIGQPICIDGQTYQVSFTADNGFVSTSTPSAVINGNLVTAPVGTNFTMSITGSTTACGSYSLLVGSPADCPDSTTDCSGSPLASVSGPSCNGNTTYAINIAIPTGVTVVSSTGARLTSSGSLTASIGTSLSLTASNGICPPQSLTIASPVNCLPICPKPVLTVSGPECNTTNNTYSVTFTSSVAAVVASAGTVQGTTVLNIPFGTNVVISASNSCGVTSSTVVAPPTCSFPEPCTAVAQLSVGQAVCLGTSSYQVSVTATSG